jgi:anti-anti-sigma factor
MSRILHQGLGKKAEMEYKHGALRIAFKNHIREQSGGERGAGMGGSNALSSTRGFRVQRREADDCTIVECFGRLTSDNVPALKEAMREACDRKMRIVLDLKEVPMMDSSGLGAVVTLYVSARTRGCRLEVENASKQILELFSMTNVLSLFESTGRCGRLM